MDSNEKPNCYCKKIAAFQVSSGSKTGFKTNWCFQHAPLYVICPETDQAKSILMISSYKTLLPKKHQAVFTKVQVVAAGKKEMTCKCGHCLVCAMSKKTCDFCPCNLNTAGSRFLQINGVTLLACRYCLDYRLKEITTIPKYKSKFVFPKYQNQGTDNDIRYAEGGTVERGNIHSGLNGTRT